MNYRQNLVKNWLKLAIYSILAAGLLTIIVVFSRVPMIKDIFPLKDFFHTALIVHVNLSVVFWMLLMNITLSSLFIPINKTISRVTICIAGASLILFSLSAFISTSDPILNNYIPMLDNNSYYSFALITFFSITFTLSLYFCWKSYSLPQRNLSTALTLCPNLLVLAAFAALILTSLLIIPNVDEYNKFEYLFWGFGHILQFTYVSIMMSAWIYMFDLHNSKDKNLYIIISLHCVFGLIGLLGFAQPNFMPQDYLSFYTKHMGMLTAIIPFILVIYLMAKKEITNNNFIYGFYSSLLLFAYGGLISLFIKDSNTIIPAHYHGSTVGVTIALMSGCYLIMHRELKLNLNFKLVKIQPLAYLSGQILHITGLAISGGYGALRKSPDSLTNSAAKFWMGIMGLGGLLSLIGGFLFIYICYTSFRKTYLNDNNA